MRATFLAPSCNGLGRVSHCFLAGGLRAVAENAFGLLGGPKGYLTQTEFGDALRAIGFTPSQTDVRAMGTLNDMTFVMVGRGWEVSGGGVSIPCLPVGVFFRRWVCRLNMFLPPTIVAGEKNSLDQLLSAASSLSMPSAADNDDLLDAWR